MGVVEIMGGGLGYRSREGEKKMGRGVGNERESEEEGRKKGLGKE